uniref:Uncharacterized protein n=1 Tax=Geoglobus ahangari TaxID=113653 RepID=A0A7C3UGM8_9EURY
MVREVIATYILVIATVVAVSSVSLAIIPTVRDLANSYISISEKLNERVKTDIDIIFISANDKSLTVWLKNTGNTVIPKDLIAMSDIFVVSSESSYHFALSSATYEITNGDGDEYWEKGETMMIQINVSLPPNEYLLTFVLYNGVKVNEVFSR